MNTEQMKSEVIKVYPGDKWKNRVLKMSDNQVLAIFTRFKNERKIK